MDSLARKLASRPRRSEKSRRKSSGAALRGFLVMPELELELAHWRKAVVRAGRERRGRERVLFAVERGRRGGWRAEGKPEMGETLRGGLPWGRPLGTRCRAAQVSDVLHQRVSRSILNVALLRWDFSRHPANNKPRSG